MNNSETGPVCIARMTADVSGMFPRPLGAVGSARDYSCGFCQGDGHGP